MAQARPGDTVKVHYTGKLTDDTIFDSSLEQDPLEFTLGTGEIIPGFEEAVVGMQPGEAKTVTIISDEAYGPYREEMVLEVDRNQFPTDMAPEVGQQFEISQPDGNSTVVLVTAIQETNVVLDANHPLAGQDLTFNIQLMEIV
jgi:FKBP-type peptidyl-prolyl cis-trans isomerase 2